MTMACTLIFNANVAGRGTGWVLVHDSFIANTGVGTAPDAVLHLDGLRAIDAGGRLLMPGVIDCHVHFREPGLTDNADIYSESRAAAAGGTTSFFDMPNTVPQTTGHAEMQQKADIAARTSVANYAFFPGATDSNTDELLALDPSSIPGIKLFLGSSTGNMLVKNNEALDRLFAGARVPIVVHAEDEAIISANTAAAIKQYGSREAVPVTRHPHIRSAEACLAATARAITLAEKHGAHLHIAHVSTADEIGLIRRARARGLARITCEVSPHHLLFCDDDYATLGTRIKINPSVKSAAHRDALRRAVSDGTVDIIATDHAPHVLSRKQGGALTAASGAPMVQFAACAMLGLFGPETVSRTMCANPANIFGVRQRGILKAGMYADLVLYSRHQYTVTDADVLSKCGWTPLSGQTLDYKADTVLINGLTYSADMPFRPGMPLTFSH